MSANGQEVSEKQLEMLKRNITKLDRWLEQANTEKSGLSQALRKQEKEIADVSQSIRATNARLEKTAGTLSDLKRDQKKQGAALAGQKAKLIEQLQAIYKQGNQPALKILLDSDNPQETARYLNYFAYINDARGAKIDAFKSSIEALESTKQRILVQQTKLNTHKAELRKHRLTLQDSQATRRTVLAKLNANIESESQRLTKLKADQSRLESLLKEVEIAIANLELPSDAAPFSRQKTKLPWPTSGKVLQRFGSRFAQGKLKANGIQIATREDQTVQAVHSGRVVFSDWIRGFGLLLIIDHGEGYMSLYGNNKSLLKETGDWVRSRELLAYATDSSDKNESGLYFEIRRHGKPLNPTKWLRK